MNDDSVHNPELPGVRTFKKDAESEADGGFSFGGIKLTVPEKTSPGSADTARGGTVGGGKQLFDVERAFNNETVQEGTIVTDRKRSRTSTGALLKSAWTEWWGNTQKSVVSTVDKLEFLKPKEEQTVETPEKRVTIIQEAAKLARQVPKDDHAVVVEKVRTFAHDAETATGQPYFIKEAKPSTKAEWQKSAPSGDSASVATSGPATPIPTVDLRSSAVAPTIRTKVNTPLTSYAPRPQGDVPQTKGPVPVATERPKVASFRTPEKMAGGARIQEKKTSLWPSARTEKKAALIDLRETVGSREQAGVSVPRVEAPSVPRAPRVTEALPRTSSPEVTEERQPLAVSPVAFERAPETGGTYHMSASTLSTPHASVLRRIGEMLIHVPRELMLLTIVLVGGGLGVLTAILVMNTEAETPTPVITSPSVPSFLNVGSPVPVPLGADQTSFYQSVREVLERGGDAVVSVYATRGAGGDASPATTEQVVSALAWRAPGQFTRALSAHTMFGAVSGERVEPFIILQSSNFDLVFAGMLSWEPNMSEDLAPLFGTPLSGRQFGDALASNRSIRILKDEQGNERIVYAFVNKNLIIITTSTGALSRIIERVQ